MSNAVTDNPMDFLNDNNVVNIDGKSGKKDTKTIKRNLSGGINKKAILYLIIGLVALVGLFFSFKDIFGKKDGLDEEDAQALSSTRLPSGFARNSSQYEEESIQSYDIEPEQLASSVTSSRNSGFVTNSYSEPVQEPQVIYVEVEREPTISTITASNGYLSEEEIEARRSSLVKDEYNDVVPQVSNQVISEEQQRLARMNDMTDRMYSTIDNIMSGEAVGTIGNNAMTPMYAGTGGQSSYDSQNDQQNKIDYFNNNTDSAIGVSGIANNNMLLTGTIISGVLINGINTDLPGAIIAEVDQNVYDTLTGENLLIPVGSRLSGSYNSEISYQQRRMQISWTKIIRPDGLIIDIGNMPGVDEQGYSGMEGKFNNHFWQKLGGVGLTALMSVIGGEFSYMQNSGTLSPTMSNVVGDVEEPVNDWGNEIIERSMNIQPTITVKPATPIDIFITTEIQLPPVELFPVVEF